MNLLSYALIVWKEWSSHMMYTTFSGFPGAFLSPEQETAAAVAAAPVITKKTRCVFITIQDFAATYRL